MGKRVAILQSNYIPWKGYFDLINWVDEFILYDTAQYTKNDWRNRNLVKSPAGPRWLTIPVAYHFGQPIQDTKVSDPGWAKRHWGTLVQYYSKAAGFADYSGIFEALYLSTVEPHLSLINHRFLTEICRILGIRTRISWSKDYQLAGGQTERLVNLCLQAGASEYLSGPAAKNYLNEALFEQAGIRLVFIDYAGYPEYRQLHGPFEHRVSILDLIFNEGFRATQYMKSFPGVRQEKLVAANRP